jgi:purine-binding chemotaxis protein CheW
MSEPLGLNTLESRGLALRPEGDQNRFLTFTLGRDAFAMDIRSIKEVIQFAEITEVPLAPPAIRGVINLRGSVVPVIDLAVRFGWTPTQVARRTCVVIVELDQEGAQAVLGVVVDQVREVLEIPPQDIEPPPSFGGRLRTDFLLGVGKARGQFILLLAADRVLDIEELAAHATPS